LKVSHNDRFRQFHQFSFTVQEWPVFRTPERCEAGPEESASYGKRHHRVFGTGITLRLAAIPSRQNVVVLTQGRIGQGGSKESAIYESSLSNGFGTHRLLQKSSFWKAESALWAR
jgi:hypothetical protein